MWLILIISVKLLAGEIELAEQLRQSDYHNQPIPLVSLIKPNLSIEQAYTIQRYYVTSQLTHEKPAGFKAGLTSLATQREFNVTKAVTGILFAKGDRSATKAIELSQFNRLMLETEIGFEIGKEIKTTVANITELKSSITALFPVIELPESGFTHEPTGIDIIAANVGSKAYLKGKAMTDFTLMDLNTLPVTLTKNGKVVNTGEGHEVLGDQWQTALWLVNQLIAQGWTLTPGQFLITGVIGKMIKAEVGNYQADFGKLGRISVAIIP
jgi:2-keto-4-pentenoate hydratase